MTKPLRKKKGGPFQRELDIRKAIAEVAESLLQASTDIKAIAEIILTHSLKLTGSRHGYVSLIDSDSHGFTALTLVQKLEEEGPISRDTRKIILDRGPHGFTGLHGHVLNTKRGFFTNSPQRYNACGNFPEEHIPIQRFLAVPAISGGNVIGQISLANAPRHYTGLDLEIVKRLTDFYRLALEKKQWEEELNAHRHQLEELVKNRTRDLQETIDHLLMEVMERRRAEEALRKNEEKYRSIINSAQEGFNRLDEDLKIVEVNHAFCHMLGYREEEILGKKITEITHPDGLGLLQEQVSKIPTTAHRNYETTLMARDGSAVHVNISATSIRDLSTGKITGSFAFLTDVTLRKKIEAELIKAQRLESLGLLAGGIAHDFNNMLTALSSKITLAIRYLEPGHPSHQKLMESQRMFDMAKGLSHQLLTFSKGGGASIRKHVSLGQLLKDNVNFALSGSTHQCRFSIPNDLWTVEVDPAQISQVIHNLILNATQAMREDGLLELKAENVETGENPAFFPPTLPRGQYVRIEIKDNGIGIPESHFLKIFDPYFTTKKKGSGLGLAICYSIIKKHNGHIMLESTVGQGTRFFIYLPASMKKSMAEEKSRSPETTPLRRWKLLIMDDEEEIARSVGEILGERGYVVETALDGREAISKYKIARETAAPFHVVLMDLTIPGGMGGTTAIRELQKIDPDVKAVLTSGYAQSPIMEEHHRYGFRGAIPKPFTIEQLDELLQGLIHKSQQKNV